MNDYRGLGYDPAALDRYITGNYGEDQFRGMEEEEDRCDTCDELIEDCECNVCIYCGVVVQHCDCEKGKKARKELNE